MLVPEKTGGNLRRCCEQFLFLHVPNIAKMRWRGGKLLYL
jgi:hypothetical protein